MIQKYRCFDKEGEEMKEVDGLYFPTDGNTEVIIEGNAWEVDEYIALMQSTGLFDKNGVEIFEGDIVKPDRAESFVVNEFVFKQGVFKKVSITDDGYSFEGVYHGEQVEVIGNVYENPELLEVNNDR